MLKKRIIIMIFLCIGVLTFYIRAETASQVYDTDISKGLGALKQNENDSALFYFWQASQKGMSQDSLFYFLAELYINRGIYDTALALNYAIKAEKENDFKRGALKQRYGIFSVLGMINRADETLDSLWFNKGRTARDFLPGVYIYSSTGYNSDYEWNKLKYPWHTKEIQPTGNTIAGFNHDLRLRATWRIPVKRTKSFFFAGEGSLGKPYRAEYEKLDGDSVSYAGGITCGFNGLFDHLQVSYTWVRKKSYFNKLSSANSITVLFTDFTDRNFYFINALYGIEVGRQWKIENQYINLLGNITGRLHKSNQISVGALAMLLIMDAVPFNDSTYRRDIVDFEKALDTTFPGMVFITTNPSVIQGVYTHNTKQYMPNTNITLSPSVAFEQSLPARFSITANVQWAFAYYFKKYEWSDFKMEMEENMPYHVTINKADNQYYWIMKKSIFKSDITGDIFDDFTHGPIERHSRRRIDNSLSLALSLRHIFKMAGTLEFKGGAGKMWSTLSDDLPVSVQNWNWHTGMQWYKHITWARKNRHEVY